MAEISPQPADDREMLARLWMEAQPLVLGFLCAAVPRFHDAEDLLQQVAMEAARSFDNYDRSRPFAGWAIGIARHRLARYFQEQKSQKCIFSSAALDALAQYQAAQAERSDPLRDALDQCLAQLGAKARGLLAMRYEEKLSSTDMGARAGLTEGSIRVALTRIRRQLVECIRGKLALEG